MSEMNDKQRATVKRFYAMTKPGEHRHALVAVYSRPWRRFFRKSHEIRCWTCEVIVYAYP